MITSTLIEKIYTRFRGKGVSKTPVFNSEKANIALSIANTKLEDWAREPNVKWLSNFKLSVNEAGTVATTGTITLTGTNTYFTDYAVGDKITVSGETVRTIDTITSDTVLTVSIAFTNTASALTFTRKPIITSSQTYNLPRSFFTPSDEVTVRTTTQDIPLQLANAQYRTDGDVYIHGINPKKITFYNATTSMIGGELIVPGYFVPEPLVLATDIVPIDDTEWLILATAAELARNDAAKASQFANLTGMSNDRYSKMISANMMNGNPQGMSIPNNMPQISPELEDWTE